MRFNGDTTILKKNSLPSTQLQYFKEGEKISDTFCSEGSSESRMFSPFFCSPLFFGGQQIRTDLLCSLRRGFNDRSNDEIRLQHDQSAHERHQWELHQKHPLPVDSDGPLGHTQLGGAKNQCLHSRENLHGGKISRLVLRLVSQTWLSIARCVTYPFFLRGW